MLRGGELFRFCSTLLRFLVLCNEHSFSVGVDVVGSHPDLDQLQERYRSLLTDLRSKFYLNVFSLKYKDLHIVVWLSNIPLLPTHLSSYLCVCLTSFSCCQCVYPQLPVCHSPQTSCYSYIITFFQKTGIRNGTMQRRRRKQNWQKN